MMDELQKEESKKQLERIRELLEEMKDKESMEKECDPSICPHCKRPYWQYPTYPHYPVYPYYPYYPYIYCTWTTVS